MTSTESAQYHQAFTDLPLESASQIRLVELLPGPLHSPILCKLKRVQYDESTEYNCLSYTWGSDEDPIIIQLKAEGGNVADLSVTRNLGIALRHLRQEDGPRTLWIDALCINQNDVEEKRQQVALMPVIYGSADRVLVWLGPGTHGSDRIMDEFENHDSQEDFGERLFEEKNARLRRALEALLERDYWSRAWVVQEIFKAKEITVLCGQKTASWTNVTFSMEAFVQKRIELMNQSEEFTVISSRTVAMRPQTLDTLGHLSTYRLYPEHERGPLWLFQMLLRLRHFKCKDPRDKIFSLLGLVDPESLLTDDSQRPAIYVDYHLSHRHVSTRLFEWCVTPDPEQRLSPDGHGGILNILCASQPAQSEQFPSWLPDFSKDDGTFPWPTFPLQAQARFPCEKPTFSDDYSVLSIQARRITVLEEHGMTSRFDDCQAADDIGLLARLHAFMELSLVFKQGLGIRRTSFWDVLVLGGHSAAHVLSYLILAEPKVNFRDPVSIEEALKVGISKQAGRVTLFMNDFRQKSFRRRFAFVNLDGRYYGAMVPAAARPGDIVYLPGDCDYPVLLRNKKPDPGKFVFVGPCCIPDWKVGSLEGYGEIETVALS